MRAVLVLLLLLSGCLTAWAQPTLKTTVHGVLVDSATHAALPLATLTLRAAADSSLVSVGLTDEQGQFAFNNLPKGTYRLTISYLGYQSRRQAVSLSTDRATLNLGTIYLSARAVRLSEVNVLHRPPIRIKNDTLEFDAGSFGTRPNTVVEDVLGKLPGVAVASDGSVRAQGQTVQQVFVDGKLFFGSDPKVATRNLPASLIAKIQIYDKRSDQSAFSGVDDGSRIRTINIITKPEGRQGLFGQQVAGYGTDGRYQAGAGLNRFRQGKQFSLLGQANNINLPGYSLPTYSSRRGGSNSTPSTGITRSLGGGSNYAATWRKRLDVTASYLLVNSKTAVEQTSRRQTIIPVVTAPTDTATQRSALISENHNAGTNQTAQHSLNLRLNYRLDSLNSIRITPSISAFLTANVAQTITRTLSALNRLLNQSLFENTSAATSLNASNTTQWLHRFRRRTNPAGGHPFGNSTLSVNLNTTINQSATNGINRAQNQFYDIVTGRDTNAVNQLNQQSEQDNRSLTNELTVAYTNPVSVAGTMEIRYSGSVNRSNAVRRVADFNEQTGAYDRPNVALSSRYQSEYVTSRFGSSWQARRPGYTYTAGMDVQQATLHTDNLGGSTLTRRYVNLLPVLLFQSQLVQNQSLQLGYQSRINSPSVAQLQPVADVTNPLFIRVGNPNLQPEYTHQVSVNYNRFHTTTYRTVFALLTVELTNHRIVTATTVDTAGIQTVRPINANGVVTANGSVSIGRPVSFHALKANLNTTTMLFLNRGISYVNGQPNQSLALTVGQTVSLNGTLGQTVEVSLSGTVNYQRATYSRQNQPSIGFVSSALTTQFVYSLPFHFVLASDFTYKANAGGSAGYNQRFALWNAYISRHFFGRQQAELRLQVFDLFNQNRSIIRTVTDTYVEDIQSRVLKRYGMLSFIYNLHQFGTGKGQ